MDDQQESASVFHQKECTRLARQVARLQATLDRNKAAAASMASITAMQTIEKRRQEQYMRLLLENSPAVIFLFDEEGRFSYCTKNFLTLARIPHFAAINGKYFREVFYQIAEKTWVDELDDRLIAAVKSHQSLEFEVSLNISGKEARRYVVQFVPMIVTDADSAGGSLMMLQDITEIRKIQENAEKARELAENASLAKSTFLSNMSHEIRTPMNAIIGMTAIASASDDSEKKEYCLTKITEASTHLLGVINDILDMSKIEANKFELFHADFSFENLLQKVVSIINFRVEERQQDFSIHLDPNIPAVIKSDEQRLSQVLTNLLSNAVKFTPEKGQIRLNTALLEEKDGDCIIRFDVTDTGIGITEEQQSRLFNSFEQADSSTSRKFGGTGLGLAISKRIVGMMDGHIWVESESGKGSTFAFTIKVKRRSEENMDSIRSNVTPDNLRIMVIDDAPEVLEYFSNVTQKLGCQCDAVSSGEAACEKINSNGAYDLYFVDWKMPGMDGIELSRKIKEHNPKLPVIVMISSTEWNVIEKDARAAGVDRFLQKPVFPSDIVNCINECVGVKEEVAKKGVVPEGIFEGKRVLLAEDVKINREIVIVRLEPTKVQMDCAVNGLEAVEKFIAASGKYDMIFMDMQMPEMDGLEATIAIRALNMREAGEVPIVAMTANVFQEDIEKCLAAGMNDHISKPLDFALVIDKMKKYI